jgi:hypothetical protein
MRITVKPMSVLGSQAIRLAVYSYTLNKETPHPARLGSHQEVVDPFARTVDSSRNSRREPPGPPTRSLFQELETAFRPGGHAAIGAALPRCPTARSGLRNRVFGAVMLGVVTNDDCQPKGSARSC